MLSTIEKDLRRKNRADLERALREAKAEFKGATIRCPFHEDKTPSGSIYEGEDGAWRFKCHAANCKFCGDVFDVIERSTGRKVEDQLRELQAPPTQTNAKPARVFPTVQALRESVDSYRSVEAVHQYANPDTRAVELVIVRCRDGEGKKTFLQCRPVPGGFSIGAPPKPHPIYNRTRIRPAAEVIVVEGEKCVEALAAIGVPATTSPGGAGKAEYADWSALAGKTVYLWPDNDPPDPKTEKSSGIEHMKEVAAHLQQLKPAPRIFWIDPEILGLPPKGDVVDYLDLMEPDEDRAEAIWLVCRKLSESLGIASEVGKLIDDTISGKWRSIDWPHKQLSLFAKSLFPGTVTLICGDPGSTKSFLILDAMRHWHEEKIPVALYMLEDDRRCHMLRALAQMSTCADITDDEWVRNHAARAKELFREYEPRLESFGAVIASPGEKHPTPAELAEWVEKKCTEGCQIIAIDPITYAAFSDKPWQDDKQFLWSVTRSLRRSGARLILITHPRKAGAMKSTGALDDMAGGAAYPRHSQTVLWVTRKEPADEMDVFTSHGLPTTATVDRIIRIPKSRHGKGTGQSIGYLFGKDNLRFKEQGIIRKAKAGKPAVKDPWGAPKQSTQSLDLDETP